MAKISIFCLSSAPAMTNTGLCYAFNALSPRDILAPSAYLDSLEDAYRPELANHTLEMAFEGLNGHGFTVYLDRQEVMSMGGLYKVQDGGGFRVSIGSRLNSFNVKALVSKIRLGFETEIQVSVKELSVSEGVKNNPKSDVKWK